LEQLGAKRHVGPSNGEIAIWYERIVSTINAIPSALIAAVIRFIHEPQSG
jgi:hypothetical protein